MLAWLHTAPEQPEPPQQSLAKVAKKEEPITRLQAMEKDGQEPVLPEVECGEHLVGYLMQIGPVNGGQMGDCAITEADLHYWQRNTGLILPPWQCALIRSLSRAWLHQKQQSTDPNCPPPWMAAIDRDQRAEVAKQLSDTLRRRAKEKGRNHVDDKG